MLLLSSGFLYCFVYTIVIKSKSTVWKCIATLYAELLCRGTFVIKKKIVEQFVEKYADFHLVDFDLTTTMYHLLLHER